MTRIRKARSWGCRIAQLRKIEPAHLKPRQAVDDTHLFAGVELVDAQRDDLRPFRRRRRR